jgi:hypothetical protein
VFFRGLRALRGRVASGRVTGPARPPSRPPAAITIAPRWRPDFVPFHPLRALAGWGFLLFLEAGAVLMFWSLWPEPGPIEVGAAIVATLTLGIGLDASGMWVRPGLRRRGKDAGRRAALESAQWPELRRVSAGVGGALLLLAGLLYGVVFPSEANPLVRGLCLVTLGGAGGGILGVAFTTARAGRVRPKRSSGAVAVAKIFR